MIARFVEPTTEPAMARCSAHKGSAPVSEFHRNRSRPNGLAAICRSCAAKYLGRRLVPVVCPVCGRTYQRKDPRQVCCSRACGFQTIAQKRERGRLVALLADGQPRTNAEIARVLYGWAEREEIRALQSLIWAARRAGLPIVSSRQGRVWSYRLAVERQQEAS